MDDNIYAVIDSGVVTNLIVGPSNPKPGETLVASPPSGTQIGWLYDGATFSAPPLPRDQLIVYASQAPQVAWLGSTSGDLALYRLHTQLTKLREKTETFAAIDAACARIVQLVESGELTTREQIDGAIGHGP